MPPKNRSRGGREARVRLSLDMCKLAHRRGDVEAKKRALETICVCYDIDPTQLTNQGIKGLRRSDAEAEKNDPAPPSSTTPAPVLQVESPALMDTTLPVTDPQTLDLLLDDIEEFITGQRPQR